eukprot:GHVN01095437.1.p1 GENE.GHVN01095437.1~~GHVN01095437.1.p1  ORF type:complete len:461 (-),score=39.99 GHVN01095437.1:102-1325(-)
MDKDSEIRGTFFGQAVDKFFSNLQMDKVYTFSKGQIMPCNARFNSLGHPYEIRFGEDAVINPAEEDSLIPKKTYAFTKIGDLGQKAAGDTIDVLAVVSKVTPVTSITIKATGQPKEKRELTLIDDTNCSIDLTLWGDKCKLDEDLISSQPVVACKGVRVGDYQGRSLSTGYGSQLDFNPQDQPDGLALHSWWIAHGKSIEPQKMTASPIPRDETRVTIEELTQQAAQQPTLLQEKGIYFATTTTVMPLDSSNKYFWVACPDCNRKVQDQSADEGGDPGSYGGFFCPNCSKNVDVPVRKYLLNLRLADCSGDLRATAFSNHGEQIMCAEADHVENARAEPDKEGKMLEDFFQEASFSEWVFRVQAKSETYMDERRTKYRIVRADRLNSLLEQESDLRMKYIRSHLNIL